MCLRQTLFCVPAIFDYFALQEFCFSIQTLWNLVFVVCYKHFLHFSNFFMEFVICECPVSNTLGLALTFLEIFAKHPIYINFASGLVYIYKVVWSCKICKKEKYSQLGHFGWISGCLCGSLGFLYFFALQAFLKIRIFRLAIS